MAPRFKVHLHGLAPRLATCLLALVCACGWATPVLAHPFHISVAEMELNTETGRFEVSLKLHAIDLEQALEKLAKRSIDLEHDEGLDELMQSYLAQHVYFFVPAAKPAADAQPAGQAEPESRPAVSAEQSVSKVHYVGSEIEQTWMWLHFEIEPPQGQSELALANTVLLQQTDHQINTITIRHQGEKLALRMNVKTPWHPFPSKFLP